MKMPNRSFLLVLSLLVFTYGCNSNQSDSQAAVEQQAAPKTPVTIAYPSDTAQLSNEITLNATATYLLKSDVKANTMGYITRMNIKLADQVSRGQVLFGLQTKEARALGTTISKLDSSFRFSGFTTVVSPASGYVEMVNHQVGDYVQDGDILATITDASSFGFVMDVPYEYNQLIIRNGQLTINLPDGRNLVGHVAKIMPAVSPESQTQKVLVKVQDGGNIPENLIATIQLTKQKASGISVPKTAVLTDEAQSTFWVMKLINDTTAVEIDIRKGIETDERVQVLSENLTVKDRIIISGNYGLSDTASVNIQK